MSNPSVQKLLYRDIIHSFSYGKYKYLIFYLLVVILTAAESLQAKAFNGNSASVFYYLLKDTGYFQQLSDYEIPVNWMFILFVVLFLISDFLVYDFKVNSHYLLIRIQNKGRFILSKIVWMIVQNVLLYAGIFIIVYLISGFILGEFSFAVSPFYQEEIASLMNIQIGPLQLVRQIFLGYVMTSIVLSGIFLLCMQFVKPLISFCCVIFLSALSIFLDWKWLPAIHSMILKRDIFTFDQQLTIQFSAVYSFLVYVLISFLTYFLFRKKDIF